ncbi:MAG: DUF4255 domain-containing protein [Actinomycetota bacterium]|nr:DUF4255 domain-containing protein [Actinomycetota bacterium]
MAGNRGIESTTTALIRLLEDAIAGSGLPAIRCAAYRAADLTAPMGEGISLYLHQVSLDASHTRPPAAGGVARTAGLELHYLLTAWSPHTGRQQRLLGWAVQSLLATPILSAERLNGDEEIFAADEQVTVTWEALSIEQLAAIWQVAPMSRQPSGSFVARFQLG